MSWSFGLARSWEDAYGEALPRVRGFAERYATSSVNWSASLEVPPVPGMQLPYALVAPVEALLARWTKGRPLRRIDVMPFTFRADAPTQSSYDLEEGWCLLDGAAITDGLRYSWDEAHAAEVDRLAPLFTGAVPHDDHGWAIASAGIEKRLYELAQAAFDTGLPVTLRF